MTQSVDTSHGMCMEVRGQLWDVSFHLPLRKDFNISASVLCVAG